MKVEVTNKEKKFEPIELKITIESEEELCSLYLRHSITSHSVNEIAGRETIHEAKNSDYEFFRYLNELIETKYPHLKK